MFPNTCNKAHRVTSSKNNNNKIPPTLLILFNCIFYRFMHEEKLDKDPTSKLNVLPKKMKEEILFNVYN